MANRYTPLHERFWRRVQVMDGCWPWLGGKRHYGYGSISVGGRSIPAHRVSWELHFGPIPDGAWVLHRCDNPPCVNPGHLFLGDNAANTRDRDQKGRQGNARKRYCKRGHPLEAYNLIVTSRGYRNCRTCRNDLHRIGARARYWRRKSAAAYAEAVKGGGK